ncbi:MAG TPA: tetratricopeptide repeat protein [Sedimenticola sp.]|nr:tetratricopeptide repeat protein [Sedimenticola sp.]
MKPPLLILPILMSLLLTGCLDPYYRPGAPVKESSSPARPPAPVQTAGRETSPPGTAQTQAPTGEQDQGVQIAAYTPPPRVRARPVTSQAVAGLVQRAGQQRQAGDLAGAAATLERALRIEPRNAHLWHRLARIRLEQKRYDQAEGLAAKSNSLAAADRDLRRENWRLIARARRTAGNLAGAREAESQVARMR